MATLSIVLFTGCAMIHVILLLYFLFLVGSEVEKEREVGRKNKRKESRK